MNLTHQPVRQKMPREVSKDYKGFIAALSCVICGAGPEVAHVRFGRTCPRCEGRGWIEDIGLEGVFRVKCVDCHGAKYRYGKRPTGAGEKPSDWWTLPLCPQHHRLGPDCQHSMNEAEFWQKHGIDALHLCTRLQDIYNSSPTRAGAIESAMAMLEGLKCSTPQEHNR